MGRADEMKAVQAAHARPGFRQKWLSVRVIEMDGLRGWTPIIRGGELVKMGGMILAEMPEKAADIRQEFFQQLDRRQQALMDAPAPCGAWWCRLKRFFKRER